MMLTVKSKFKESAFWGCLIYTYVTTLFFVVVGSICLYASNSIVSHTVTSSAINTQVISDW